MSRIVLEDLSPEQLPLLKRSVDKLKEQLESPKSVAYRKLYMVWVIVISVIIGTMTIIMFSIWTIIHKRLIPRTLAGKVRPYLREGYLDTPNRLKMSQSLLALCCKKKPATPTDHVVIEDVGTLLEVLPSADADIPPDVVDEKK